MFYKSRTVKFHFENIIQSKFFVDHYMINRKRPSPLSFTVLVLLFNVVHFFFFNACS